MANKMLIDASHPEETRVVVLRGNRIEEFDFESASKKPLRGNIYLAKVTRVEPSLQAAFVEYGGNRHGFLAFSEIHPDYYQIPVADRQALLDDERRQHAEEEEEASSRGSRREAKDGDKDAGGKDQRRSRRNRRRNGRNEPRRARNGDESVTGEVDLAESQTESQADEQNLNVAAHADGEQQAVESHGETQPVAHEDQQPNADWQPASEGSTPSGQPAETAEAAPESAPESAPASWTSLDAPVNEALGGPQESEPASVSTEAGEADEVSARAEAPESDERHEAPEARQSESDESDDEDEDDQDDGDDDSEEEEEHVEQLGGDDIEEMPARSGRPRRQYKIQEVIRRRQILLVQVVKEERGNKGAALTTYLSLAGRYSVLMPNTARGGGISRKITDNDDRKRLKEIAQQLEVPEGMGVILRTAGAARTPPEVRRDFEYLLRMWESVREITLESTAPTLVYEEGSLIKRSIRDLYGKEIDEVIVAGEAGFKEARDYMGMLMPSHVKNVKPWGETHPLFARTGVEAQLDAMFSAQVTLKSGGYIVINQTEALVAIDVNSGRSTREHNIEDTALRTNLEAADEVARQLRLRDLAGLIVVDFIDMEENRNNRAVERRLKEALKNDRARIQVGRISHFGLLEMSRQRMRTGVLEGSSVVCPHCNGAGTVRSVASISLHILRVIEDALVRNAQHNLTVRTRSHVALYILNQKRAHLRDIEERFGVTLTIEADDTLQGQTYHALERGELASAAPAAPKQGLVRLDSIAPLPEIEEEADESEDDEDETDEETSAAENGAENGENGAGENGDGRKRRRRRRRRGRDRDSSGIDPDAPQPSDDALEALAQIGGDMNRTESGQSGPRRSRRNQLPALDLPMAPDGDVDDAEAEKEGEELLTAANVEGAEGNAETNGEGRDGKRRRRSRRNRRGERDDHTAEPGFRSPYGSWVRSPDSSDPDFVADASVVDLSAHDVGAPDAAPRAEASSDTGDHGVETQPQTPSASELMSAPAQTSSAPAYEALVERAFEAMPQPAAEPVAAAPEKPAPEAAVEQAPVAEAQAAPAPAQAPEPAPARAVEALPEAPPPSEKRQGWWSRAKAQITGN